MTNHMAADHSHDAAATAGAPDTELPRWSVSDVHESFEARSFLDAMDRNAADMARLEALFDELGVRAIEPRPVTEADGRAAANGGRFSAWDVRASAIRAVGRAGIGGMALASNRPITEDWPAATRHSRSAAARAAGSAPSFGYPMSSAICSTNPTVSDRPARSDTVSQASARAIGEEDRENRRESAVSGAPTRNRPRAVARSTRTCWVGPSVHRTRQAGRSHSTVTGTPARSDSTAAHCRAPSDRAAMTPTLRSAVT